MTESFNLTWRNYSLFTSLPDLYASVAWVLLKNRLSSTNFGPHLVIRNALTGRFYLFSAGHQELAFRTMSVEISLAFPFHHKLWNVGSLGN